MTDSEIDADVSFQRALYLLEHKISDPSALVTMWRMLQCTQRVPWPEKSNPWYLGLEHLIK